MRAPYEGGRTSEGHEWHVRWKSGIEPRLLMGSSNVRVGQLATESAWWSFRLPGGKAMLRLVGVRGTVWAPEGRGDVDFFVTQVRDILKWAQSENETASETSGRTLQLHLSLAGVLDDVKAEYGGQTAASSESDVTSPSSSANWTVFTAARRPLLSRRRRAR